MYGFPLWYLVIGVTVLEIVINSCECVPVTYFGRVLNENDKEINAKKDIELINIPDELNDVDGSRSARFLDFRKFFHKRPEHPYRESGQFGSRENTNSIPNFYHHGRHGFPHEHGPWNHRQPDDDCDYEYTGPWDPKNHGEGNEKETPENTEKPAEVTEKPAEVTEKPAEVTEKPAEVTEKPAEVTEKPIETTVTYSPTTTTKLPIIDVRFGVGEKEEESKIYFPDDDE